MRRPARGRLGCWPAGLAGPGALLLAAALLLCGCNTYQDYYQHRQMKAAKGKGPVKIAVVTSSNLPNLTPQGAELAAKLVNERGGVLGGRKLELLQYDDEGKLPVGERLARRLASDTDVVAVIGHIYSEVAIPCSIIYGTAGLLFMSTGATDPDLTLIPNPFSFRNVPRDDAIAREMANLCKKLGQQRLVVLFERGLFSSFYGLSLAQNFSSAAVDVGLDVMHVRSYFSWQEDVRRTILQLRQSGFDAMLLVGYLPQAGHIIHQARGLGIKCCIIGPDSLDNQDLLRHAKDAADGVITTNFFRPDLDRPQTREFVAAFKKAHGKMPDSDAAASFDAVNLLVAAMKDCGSSIPLEMAQALNYMNMMPGVCSDYTFNEDGDVVGRQMWFREVIHNRFEYLPEEYQPHSTGALTR